MMLLARIEQATKTRRPADDKVGAQYSVDDATTSWIEKIKAELEGSTVDRQSQIEVAGSVLAAKGFRRQVGQNIQRAMRSLGMMPEVLARPMPTYPNVPTSLSRADMTRLYTSCGFERLDREILTAASHFYPLRYIAPAVSERDWNEVCAMLFMYEEATGKPSEPILEQVGTWVKTTGPLSLLPERLEKQYKTYHTPEFNIGKSAGDIAANYRVLADQIINWDDAPAYRLPTIASIQDNLKEFIPSPNAKAGPYLAALGIESGGDMLANAADMPEWIGQFIDAAQQFDAAVEAGLRPWETIDDDALLFFTAGLRVKYDMYVRAEDPDKLTKKMRTYAAPNKVLGVLIQAVDRAAKQAIDELNLPGWCIGESGKALFERHLPTEVGTINIMSFSDDGAFVWKDENGTFGKGVDATASESSLNATIIQTLFDLFVRPLVVINPDETEERNGLWTWLFDHIGVLMAQCPVTGMLSKAKDGNVRAITGYMPGGRFWSGMPIVALMNGWRNYPALWTALKLVREGLPLEAALEEVQEMFVIRYKSTPSTRIPYRDAMSSDTPERFDFLASAPCLFNGGPIVGVPRASRLLASWVVGNNKTDPRAVKYEAEYLRWVRKIGIYVSGMYAVEVIGEAMYKMISLAIRNGRFDPETIDYYETEYAVDPFDAGKLRTPAQVAAVWSLKETKEPTVLEDWAKGTGAKFTLDWSGAQRNVHKAGHLSATGGLFTNKVGSPSARLLAIYGLPAQQERKDDPRKVDKQTRKPKVPPKVPSKPPKPTSSTRGRGKKEVEDEWELPDDGDTHNLPPPLPPARPVNRVKEMRLDRPVVPPKPTKPKLPPKPKVRTETIVHADGTMDVREIVRYEVPTAPVAVARRELSKEEVQAAAKAAKDKQKLVPGTKMYKKVQRANALADEYLAMDEWGDADRNRLRNLNLTLMERENEIRERLMGAANE